MNFIEAYKDGQKGANKGIPLGDGLFNLSRYINGLQKKRIYVIAAAPKAGKTTLTDYGFIIQPYLYAIENQIDIEFIYFSFEIDRISKEFDFATYFLYHDFGLTHIKLENGQTVDGLDEIPLSPDYLRGRLQDDEGKLIKVKESVFEALKVVYENRIIPIFGEYSVEGIELKKGLITFIEQKDNPTGLRNYLIWKAEQHGKFITIPTYKDKTRIVGYKPYNPEKFTVVITDHLRKLIPERNFTLKQTVDKFSEYATELRNWTGMSFVHIIHTNRNIASQDRLRFAKDELYPTSEDLKDTGEIIMVLFVFCFQILYFCNKKYES